nr:hypothetical protein [uncultured Draconibacterium sp.]
MTKHIFWILLMLTSCGLSKNDDFEDVDRTSTIDKKVLTEGDEFTMTLTLKNPDSKIKESTFFNDLNASLQIWCSWYCGSQIQHAQTPIHKKEPDRTEKYLVKLQQGEAVSFDLTGRFFIENDTLKITFDKYNEILYLPKVHCDSILKCEISGMWIPGRPYKLDSYEYSFNSNKLTIDFKNND